jgi:hypothetical protein
MKKSDKPRESWQRKNGNGYKKIEQEDGPWYYLVYLLGNFYKGDC